MIKDINLIRKAAWSFHATTGLEFNELLGEATIAYYEAKATHNPKKSKLTTWAYRHIQNHLKNFSKRQIMYVQDAYIPERSVHQPPTPFFEIAELFSDSGLAIVNRVLDNPHNYLSMSAKSARGTIVKELRQEGWSWSQIWNAMGDVKNVLSLNN